MAQARLKNKTQSRLKNKIQSQSKSQSQPQFQEKSQFRNNLNLQKKSQERYQPKNAAESRDEKRQRMAEILSSLKKAYPDSKCSLIFETPFQLLVATVLSAQCTDARVNQVVPHLFKKFPDPQSMSQATLKELEELVRSTGFYKNKARSLSELSKKILESHQGEVPKDLEALTGLRGVGRKTANVILGNAYGIPGLVVDTHVGRLSRRMGFTKSLDPERVEQEMMEIVPQSDWTLYSHLLIDHGRAICMARSPKCNECFLRSDCPQVGIVMKPFRNTH